MTEELRRCTNVLIEELYLELQLKEEQFWCLRNKMVQVARNSDARMCTENILNSEISKMATDSSYTDLVAFLVAAKISKTINKRVWRVEKKHESYCHIAKTYRIEASAKLILDQLDESRKNGDGIGITQGQREFSQVPLHSTQEIEITVVFKYNFDYGVHDSTRNIPLDMHMTWFHGEHPHWEVVLQC